MDPRRNISPGYDEQSRMMRRGSLPPTHHCMEPLPLELLLENKMVSQEREIEQLTMDNRKLAASYLTMRQDLAAAKGEAEKIREHIRSIQNEGDIQIRILLDKIAKRDADIGAGDTTKKDLQQAQADARSLMTAKLELSVKLEQATRELDYSRESIRKIPEMRSELDNLRQEYQRLRKTFEHEKSTNIEKVEQLKILEKDMIGIALEVDRLRVVVLNAERRANGSIPYMKLDNGCPLPHHGGYTDSYGRPHAHSHRIHGAAVEMMNPYGSSGFPVDPVGSGGVGAAGNAAWGGVYNTSQEAGAEVTSAPVSSGAGNAVCEEVYDTSNAQM